MSNRAVAMLIRLCAYLFCLSFAAAGFYEAILTLHGIMIGRVAVNWPVVPASVEDCTIEASTDGGATTYYLDLRYRYTVDGEQHVSTGIHPASGGGGGEELRLLYEKLSGHRVVQARYNPAVPSEAYLITGDFSKHWGAFFGSLLMVAFGVLFMLTVHCGMSAGDSYAKRLTVIR